MQFGAFGSEELVHVRHERLDHTRLIKPLGVVLELAPLRSTGGGSRVAAAKGTGVAAWSHRKANDIGIGRQLAHPALESACPALASRVSSEAVAVASSRCLAQVWTNCSKLLNSQVC